MQQSYGFVQTICVWNDADEKKTIRIFRGDVWNNHFINVLQNKKISKKIVAEDVFTYVFIVIFENLYFTR